MSLASPVFKAMLQGCFQEGMALKTMGKVEVPLPDDDLSAMKLLTNIIHGRMSLVPLEIELELFAQMAILVDKYQCKEVIRLLPPMWNKKLLNGPSYRDSWQKIACWVCIAWQFELTDEFFKATKLIQEQASCSLESLMKPMKYNLPIPKIILDELESSRLKGIRKAVKVLDDTLKRYQNATLNCTSFSDSDYPHMFLNYRKEYLRVDSDIPSHKKDCDTMILGSLTRSAIENGLYPLPKSPYTSWSLQSFTAKLRLLEANSLCFKLTQEEEDQHNVIDQLRKSINSVAPGLSLATCKGLINKTR